MAVISYLLNFFLVMFVGFRAYITLNYTRGISMNVKPLNSTIEIIILFISILLIFLIFKRKLFAGVILLGAYIAYFGTSLMNDLNGGLNENSFMSFIGIILALFNFLDLLFNNARVGKPGDKKTDWFYKNKKYEMDDDPRKDKNRYRIM